MVVNDKFSRDSLISAVYETHCFPLSTRLTCLRVNEHKAKEFWTIIVYNFRHQQELFFLV